MAATADTPKKIVIVGGGAAGFAAAEMLRREGYGGGIVMLSDDAAPPVDRPNLSKDYLAGSAPEDWMPLRPNDFYGASDIDLRLGTEVTAIDTERARSLANGGEPRLRPAAARDRRRAGAAADSRRRSPHVHTLRTLADCRAIIARRQEREARAVVIGASFIGLEVGGIACAAATSKCTSWRRKHDRWSGCSGRNSATSSARCTKSMASSFILRTP